MLEYGNNNTISHNPYQSSHPEVVEKSVLLIEETEKRNDSSKRRTLARNRRCIITLITLGIGGVSLVFIGFILFFRCVRFFAGFGPLNSLYDTQNIFILTPIISVVHKLFATIGINLGFSEQPSQEPDNPNCSFGICSPFSSNSSLQQPPNWLPPPWQRPDMEPPFSNDNLKQKMSSNWMSSEWRPHDGSFSEWNFKWGDNGNARDYYNSPIRGQTRPSNINPQSGKLGSNGITSGFQTSWPSSNLTNLNMIHGRDSYASILPSNTLTSPDTSTDISSIFGELIGSQSGKIINRTNSLIAKKGTEIIREDGKIGIEFIHPITGVIYQVSKYETEEYVDTTMNKAYNIYVDDDGNTILIPKDLYSNANINSNVNIIRAQQSSK